MVIHPGQHNLVMTVTEILQLNLTIPGSICSYLTALVEEISIGLLLSLFSLEWLRQFKGAKGVG